MAINRTFLAAAKGVSEGVNRAAKNIYAIGQTQKKLERETEEFKINKKYKDAQLEKVNFDMGQAKEKGRRQNEMMGMIMSAQRGYEEGAGPDPLDKYDWAANLGTGNVTVKPRKRGGDTVGYRKFEGELRALMDAGTPLEQVNQVISYSPYANEDFSGLMGDYNPPIKSEEFKESSGIPAFISKRKAKITPETEKVIRQLRKKEDLEELLNNAEEYKKRGVDIDAIKEYYGRA